VKPFKVSFIAQLLLIFVSGSVVGALGYRLYNLRTAEPEIQARRRPAPQDPKQFRKMVLDEMTSRLKLRADQVQKLDAIYDDTDRRFHEVWVQAEAARKKTVAPARDAIRKDQLAQIDAVLDPGQVTEYHKMLEERQQQMEKARRGRGPRGDRDRLPPPPAPK